MGFVSDTNGDFSKVTLGSNCREQAIALIDPMMSAIDSMTMSAHANIRQLAGGLFCRGGDSGFGVGSGGGFVAGQIQISI